MKTKIEIDDMSFMVQMMAAIVSSGKLQFYSESEQEYIAGLAKRLIFCGRLELEKHLDGIDSPHGDPEAMTDFYIARSCLENAKERLYDFRAGKEVLDRGETEQDLIKDLTKCEREYLTYSPTLRAYYDARAAKGK